jgi:hypothetical protein
MKESSWPDERRYVLFRPLWRLGSAANKQIDWQPLNKHRLELSKMSFTPFTI